MKPKSCTMFYKSSTGEHSTRTSSWSAWLELLADNWSPKGWHQLIPCSPWRPSHWIGGNWVSSSWDHRLTTVQCCAQKTMLSRMIPVFIGQAFVSGKKKQRLACHFITVPLPLSSASHPAVHSIGLCSPDLWCKWLWVPYRHLPLLLQKRNEWVVKHSWGALIAAVPQLSKRVR